MEVKTEVTEKKEELPNLEELEKSWTDSKDALNALLGKSEEKPEEDLAKAKGEKKKKKEVTPEEDDEDEEDDEEEEEEKSLEDSFEDDDSQEAMNVEPFLRVMVKGISEQFALIKSDVKKLFKLQAAVANLVKSFGDLQKAMREEVKKIGDQPVETKSLLKSGGDTGSRFVELKEMTKESILQKGLQLVKEGKISSIDLTKLEGRVNHNLPIPEEIANLLKEGK